MANSLIQQAQQFKMMVEQVKQQSVAYKEAAVQQVRQQMEKVSSLHWQLKTLLHNISAG